MNKEKVPMIKTFRPSDYVRSVLPPISSPDSLDVAYGFSIHRILPSFFKYGFTSALDQFKPYFREKYPKCPKDVYQQMHMKASDMLACLHNAKLDGLWSGEIAAKRYVELSPTVQMQVNPDIYDRQEKRIYKIKTYFLSYFPQEHIKLEMNLHLIGYPPECTAYAIGFSHHGGQFQLQVREIEPLTISREKLIEFGEKYGREALNVQDPAGVIPGAPKEKKSGINPFLGGETNGK